MRSAARRFARRYPPGAVRVRVSAVVPPGQFYVSREPQETVWTPPGGYADFQALADRYRLHGVDRYRIDPIDEGLLSVAT
jgi:hypothetical protein